MVQAVAKKGSMGTWELVLWAFLEDLGDSSSYVTKGSSKNAYDSEHGVWKYLDQTRCVKKGLKKLGTYRS